METRTSTRQTVRSRVAQFKEKVAASVRFMPALSPVIYHEDFQQDDEFWHDPA